MTNSPAETAYRARASNDLASYGDNARLLFALQLRYDIDDITSVAETALVDGGDDKGCDLVYVDRSRGAIIVAQGYERPPAAKPKEAAPATKADSLNAASTWLFNRKYEELPERLKSVAFEVRDAIGAGDIDCVEFWFVHNLPESVNVRNSMKTVEVTVRNNIVDAFGDDKRPDRIVATEVGQVVFGEWYEALAVHILVNEEFELRLPGVFEINGNGWDAVVTAVKASWLHELYGIYRERLFSANYREYLGVKQNRRRNEINSSIQDTAQNDAENFWVYNNGISAIVSDFKTASSGDGAQIVKITGLSIVNGAQTTGAIGSLALPPNEAADVPVRFIRCADGDTISHIVRFNNSQNPLLPADFKSNDAVQRRLRDEFRKFPGCTYLGGRRGVDRINLHGGLIPSDTCSQALAAFHCRPDVAYHQKNDIWRVDDLYQKFFCVHTTAGNALMAYSLLKAIEQKKKQLRQKAKDDSLTEQEHTQFEFLCKRGAILLFVAAMAESLETIIGRKISSRFSVSFGPKIGVEQAVNTWVPIVDALIAFCPQLSSGVNSGVKDRSQNAHAINAFCQSVEAIKHVPGMAEVFKRFNAEIEES